MDQEGVIDCFAALAQANRMAVFRLLVRAGPPGMRVSDIAHRLEMVPSTLSGHLSILKRSGLLKSTRKQREIHYAADLATVDRLVRFLLEDCCDGRFENCAEVLSLLSARAETA